MSWTCTMLHPVTGDCWSQCVVLTDPPRYVLRTQMHVCARTYVRWCIISYTTMNMYDMYASCHLGISVLSVFCVWHWWDCNHSIRGRHPHPGRSIVLYVLFCCEYTYIYHQNMSHRIACTTLSVYQYIYVYVHIYNMHVYHRLTFCCANRHNSASPNVHVSVCMSCLTGSTAVLPFRAFEFMPHQLSAAALFTQNDTTPVSYLSSPSLPVNIHAQSTSDINTSLPQKISQSTSRAILIPPLDMSTSCLHKM